MREITTKSCIKASHLTLWKDLEEDASAQVSGGRIAIGEPPAIDGLGRPVQRNLVWATSFMF